MRQAKRNLDYETRLNIAMAHAYRHLVMRGDWVTFARHYKLVTKLDQVEAIKRVRLG